MEQRYDAAVAILGDGLRVMEVAEKFGVHRDTVYVWLLRHDGANTILSSSRQPSSASSTVS